MNSLIFIQLKHWVIEQVAWLLSNHPLLLFFLMTLIVCALIVNSRCVKEGLDVEGGGAILALLFGSITGVLLFVTIVYVTTIVVPLVPELDFAVERKLSLKTLQDAEASLKNQQKRSQRIQLYQSEELFIEQSKNK